MNRTGSWALAQLLGHRLGAERRFRAASIRITGQVTSRDTGLAGSRAQGDPTPRAPIQGLWERELAQPTLWQIEQKAVLDRVQLAPVSLGQSRSRIPWAQYASIQERHRD